MTGKMPNLTKNEDSKSYAMYLREKYKKIILGKIALMVFVSGVWLGWAWSHFLLPFSSTSLTSYEILRVLPFFILSYLFLIMLLYLIKILAEYIKDKILSKAKKNPYYGKTVQRKNIIETQKKKNKLVSGVLDKNIRTSKYIFYLYATIVLIAMLLIVWTNFGSNVAVNELVTYIIVGIIAIFTTFFTKKDWKNKIKKKQDIIDELQNKVMVRKDET